MCKTTTGTQAAAGSSVRGIQPNTSGGTGDNGPPPNQFGGFQEHVPDRVFISTAGAPDFLQSANQFYSFFGLQPEDVNSVEHLLELLGAPGNTTTYQRVLIVSHAHPRGLIMPFFTGGVNGTDRQLFKEFAKSDLDGLKFLNPFSPPIFNWGSVFSRIMTDLRSFISQPANSQHSTSLTPFGLQANGTPSGDLRTFFQECFNYVFVGTPGRVKNNQGNNITRNQRNICKRFYEAIITETGKEIIGTSISGNVIGNNELSNLRDAIVDLGINGLNVGTFNYQLGIVPGNLNYFPTLNNAARAVSGDFRNTLLRSRQRFMPTSVIDIRGCRAGENANYLVAVREFFDRPENPRLLASAPRWFQSYPSLGWELPRHRADITNMIATRIFNNAVPGGEQIAAMRSWAALIKVNPLHTQFWSNLLGGPAVTFCDLTWRAGIPVLFIPAPGIVALSGLNLADLVTNLGDYFNVPAASMPNATDHTNIAPILTSITTYNSNLVAEVNTETSDTRLSALFNALKQINVDLAQSFVPSVAPNPLTHTLISQYQRELSDFLDAGPLAPIKNFMTAARDSFETGNGLYYYLLYSGLPIFFFNRSEIAHNGLVVFQPHENEALQS
ncbi:MAG: hypothetical protein KJN76_00670, partial [Eudoraea sp.]|nr:hypothetical protein [Eudoraea sp.]